MDLNVGENAKNLMDFHLDSQLNSEIKTTRLALGMTW
jgi:hypothetical protein